MQDFMRLHEGVDEAGADSTDNLSGAESVGATCIDFCRVWEWLAILKCTL